MAIDSSTIEAGLWNKYLDFCGNIREVILTKGGKTLFVNFLKSAVITAMCYYISLMVAFGLYNIIFDLPSDRNRAVSGIFIGLFVIIIPYVLLGIFMNVINKNSPIRASFLNGLLVILSERLSIYFIGWTFVSTGTDSWSYDNIISPINFVSSEALPYFTPFYIIFGGLISLVICLVSTFCNLKLSKRKVLEPKMT